MAKSSETLIKVQDIFLYRDKLSPIERKRYDDKLHLLKGEDPYMIDSKKWSTDVKLLPPVKYYDVQNYLIFTPSAYTKEDLRAYKGLEAYNQFVHGWVRDRSSIVCGDHTVVIAKVLHSQRMRETPLRPWVIGSKDGQILGAHCNCMAGLGEACTHIAALLYSIEAAVTIRDSKTVTQEKAYWLLPSSMKKVEYKEVSEIDFTAATTAKRKFRDLLNSSTCDSPVPPTPKTSQVRNKETKVPEATDAEMDSLYYKLQQSGAKSSILSVSEPFCEKFVPKAVSENFPQVLSDIKDEKCYEMNYLELVKHCEKMQFHCSKDQSNAVELATRNQSKCKLWYSFRAGRITASRAKQVCSTSRENPSQSLIKAICYPDLTKFKSEATKWGCNHEAVAKEHFLMAMEEIHENCRIEEVGFVISSAKPYIGASPDGIFSCDCCGSTLVEIKCPYCAKNDTLDCVNYLEDFQGAKRLKRNHDYFFQVQAQLGCTEMDRTYFVVWSEKEIHIEEICVCPTTWELICDSAKHLFVACVLPELVGKFYSRLPTKFRQPLVDQEVNDNDTNSNSVGTSRAAEQTFCYCDQEEFGEMIMCDNENCPIQWFHYPCVKIQKEPKGNWFCPDCRKLPGMGRKRKQKH